MIWKIGDRVIYTVTEANFGARGPVEHHATIIGIDPPDGQERNHGNTEFWFRHENGNRFIASGAGLMPEPRERVRCECCNGAGKVYREMGVDKPRGV
jgi:hypothetical protein